MIVREQSGVCRVDELVKLFLEIAHLIHRKVVVGTLVWQMIKICLENGSGENWFCFSNSTRRCP